MGQGNSRWLLLAGVILFLSVFGLYIVTAAPGIVPGDPAEYTFVAHLLGIAHPPGYAFMVLVTKLWQSLVPIGSVAQRSHWLASAAGALTPVLVFGIVWQISGHGRRAVDQSFGIRLLPPLVAACCVAAAADYWQHSIHINSHIVTVTVNALALFFLVRWWLTGRDRWLYAFCLFAGLGPTHHPLTVFSYPAYVVFIVLVRPDILNVFSPKWWRAKRWRVPLLMLGFGLLGLAVWLYYPIRSPMRPAFGPSDMNTVDGFLNVVLARGLRVNLFQFGLAEQGQRLTVFVTLLHQQYPWTVLALAAVGLGWLAMNQRRLLALLGICLVVNLAFIVNTVQDVMAYLLTPFVLIGVLTGLGANALVSLTGQWAHKWQPAQGRRWIITACVTVVLLALPAATLFRNLARISLRDYRAGDEYVTAVFDRFAGKGERVVLLNDWEHMTPLWYSQFVERRFPDPADVIPSLVSTDRPWLERVFEHLPGGPVFLSGYRREVVDAGFRLRPDGVFYQVVEPGEESVPAWIQPLPPSGDETVELVGYWLAKQGYRAGEVVSLDLAMRAADTPTDYLIPYAQLGEIRFSFTTDSHLLTPLWQPGEVIVERFSFALPHDLAAGSHALRVGLANLTTGAESEALLVGELSLSENRQAPREAVLDDLLANFGQRVGVDRVLVHGGEESRSAVWDEPLVVRPNEELDLTIKWRCLAPIEESYTVFVHLIDATNRIWDQKDYTPLGGSYPTHLWIPKWLPGQTALDPYTLTVPPDAPAGDYYLEIGLYGMTTRQRVYQYDRAGNVVGDRLVVGAVRIRP